MVNKKQNFSRTKPEPVLVSVRVEKKLDGFGSGFLKNENPAKKVETGRSIPES
jgi:hypothetical protein